VKTKAEIANELEAVQRAYNIIPSEYNAMYTMVIDVAVMCSDKELGNSTKVKYVKNVFTDFVVKQTAKMEAEKKPPCGPTCYSHVTHACEDCGLWQGYELKHMPEAYVSIYENAKKESVEGD